MKRNMAILTVGLLMCAVSMQAQEEKSTTRVERQHKISRFQKGQMKNTESSILQAIESNSPGMQRTAIQALRDLEQMYPAYPFDSLITPLVRTVKSEKSDPVVRRLAALALDELHSDAGDAAIRDVAGHSDDEGLRSLCEALLVRSNTE